MNIWRLAQQEKHCYLTTQIGSVCNINKLQSGNNVPCNVVNQHRKSKIGNRDRDNEKVLSLATVYDPDTVMNY